MDTERRFDYKRIADRLKAIVTKRVEPSGTKDFYEVLIKEYLKAK